MIVISSLVSLFIFTATAKADNKYIVQITATYGSIKDVRL